MAGKTCIGTFAVDRPSPKVKWNMGAVRLSFTTASAGMLEFAEGGDAYESPDKAQTFQVRNPFSNAVLAGNHLTLSGGASKMSLTGDGTTFTGMNDPRPKLPLTANIRISCN
jgi:hypothetical protein